ncbi:MAG: hypothetical protein RR420_00935 [Anaerovoracaceae bacterium]
MSNKIGDFVGLKEGTEVIGMLGNKSVIKAGSIGIINSRGQIMILSGESKGKILKTEIEVNMSKYNCESISEFILDRLDAAMPVSESLEDAEGIDKQRLREELEDILSDIL